MAKHMEGVPESSLRKRVLKIISKAEARAIRKAGGKKAWRKQIEALADQISHEFAGTRKHRRNQRKSRAHKA